jgi:hypothetical protein
MAQANDPSDEDGGLIDALSAWLPSSALTHREVFGTAMAFLFGWITSWRLVWRNIKLWKSTAGSELSDEKAC